MSTHHDRETDAGFSFSDDSKAKAPLRVWLAVLTAVAAGAIAWTTLRLDVADHATRLGALEGETRNTRDLLLRIDERTAEIKRRLDQPSPR